MNLVVSKSSTTTNIRVVEFASNQRLWSSQVLGQVMGWELGQVVEEYLVDCVEMRRIEGKG